MSIDAIEAGDDTFMRPKQEQHHMSWKPEVQTDDSGKWYGNALRFATKEEAEAQVKNLASRWFAVRETRVVETDDPVNYQFTDGKLIHIGETAG